MVSGSRRSLLDGKSRYEGMAPRQNGNGDLESGNRNARNRFRDVIGSVIQDGRRGLLKKKLIDGLNSDHLEKFRKSEEEVGMNDDELDGVNED